MDSHSIAILEEELGLFGYFYPKNQTCDKTGKFSASSGWTNSKFSKKKTHNKDWTIPNDIWTVLYILCLKEKQD